MHDILFLSIAHTALRLIPPVSGRDDDSSVYRQSRMSGYFEVMT